MPVLAILEAPALRVLKVDFLRFCSELGPDQWSDPAKADWAIRFIQRSNCKLSGFFPANLSTPGLKVPHRFKKISRTPPKIIVSIFIYVGNIFVVDFTARFGSPLSVVVSDMQKRHGKRAEGRRG